MKVVLLLTVVSLVSGKNVPFLFHHTPSSAEYYTAAVLEHNRRGNASSEKPSEVIQANLELFRIAAAVAKSKGADIIVFPEYGIFPYLPRKELKPYMENIPDPKKTHCNPCEQHWHFFTRPILRSLSCMAKANEMVVVANMGDVQPCSPEDEKCPEDGVFLFNTNVAFDRNGNLLSKYHKEHLFFEDSLDEGPESQDSTFTTDFGTFSMYVCFESLFKPMAMDGRNKSIAGVILSTNWLDEYPLLVAVERWLGWAVGNNATLLAANKHNPRQGAIGSGIFNGRSGPLVYTFNPDGQSKLLVSRVPKSGSFKESFVRDYSSITVIRKSGPRPYDFVAEEGVAKNMPEVCQKDLAHDPEEGETAYRCQPEITTNYTLFRLTRADDKIRLCDSGLCCTLSYSADSMDESYYFGVFNGTHNAWNRYFWCEEKCLVARCDTFNGSECSTFPTKSRTVFRRLELRSNFSTSFVYPSVAESGVRLAAVNEWDYRTEERDGEYVASLDYKNRSGKPLLVAGLNARCYDRDPQYDMLHYNRTAGRDTG